MRKNFIKLLTLLVVFSIISSVASLTVSADSGIAQADYVLPELHGITRRYVNVNGVKNRSPYAYRGVSVSFNGSSLGDIGLYINGEYYVPVRKFVEYTTDLTVSYYSSSRTMIITGGGHNISITDGAYVIYASDRPMFSLNPSVILTNGVMYAPVATLSRALSLSYSGVGTSLELFGTPRPLVSAARYYREDEVFWLARIISAEARGEPLIGQIAVGNVVLNRTRSNQFPNTIYGVIFDRKWGVQFSPILDGSIYNTPTYTATLAAKICLEGFDISGGALYFLYPRASTSSWIQSNRTYSFTVGKHDFYY